MDCLNETELYSYPKLQTDVKKCLKEYSFMYMFPAAIQTFKKVVWASEKYGDDFGCFVWEKGANVYSVFQEQEWSKANEKAMAFMRSKCFHSRSTICRGVLFTNKEKDDVLSFFASVQVQYAPKQGMIPIENIVVPGSTPAKRRLKPEELHVLSEKGVRLMPGSEKSVTAARFTVCKKGDLLSKDQVMILKAYGYGKINQFKCDTIQFYSIKEGMCEHITSRQFLKAVDSEPSPALAHNETETEPCKQEVNEVKDMMGQVTELVEGHERAFVFSIQNRRDNLVEFLEKNVKKYKFLFWRNKMATQMLMGLPLSETFKNLRKLALKLSGEMGLLFTSEPKEEVLRQARMFILIPIYY